MALTSTQTASLIGAQNAAFHNQAIQAHQIGMAAAHPQPFASMGQGVAGAAMAAMPTAVGLGTGAAMVAGIAAPAMGSAGGALGVMAMADPFAMAAASYGMAGGGAAGVGLAGAVALPLVAGAAAAAYSTKQMYAGYSQFRDVRNTVNANFQHINTGNVSGRGFDVGQIGQIASSMRGIAKESYTSMGELNKTLQTVSSMGLMQTVRDAQEFEQKFGQLLKTVKTVAKVMRTSLPDAAGMLGSMRSSGLYTAQDIMGGAVDRGVLQSHGVTGQQVTQVQRYGSQVAHAYGALRGTGARLATRLTGDVARAESLGVISAEQLIEATGMEGPAAYQAMATRLTGTAFKMTGTSIGRAMMIYAGEQVDGRYTGKIDEGRMMSLQMGTIKPGRLGGAARGQLGGRGSKLSFVANEERLRGAFAEAAGPEMMGTFVRQIVGDRFGTSSEEDVTTILMKRFTDLERTEAEILGQMAQQSRTLGRERRREQAAEVDRVVRTQEQQMWHSWGGLKSQMGRQWKRDISGPLKEVGQDIGMGIERSFSRMGDAYYGRSRFTTNTDDILRMRFGIGDDYKTLAGAGDILIGKNIDMRDMSQTTRFQRGWGDNLTVTAGNLDDIREAQAYEGRLAGMQLTAGDLGVSSETFGGLGEAAQGAAYLMRQGERDFGWWDWLGTEQDMSRAGVGAEVMTGVLSGARGGDPLRRAYDEALKTAGFADTRGRRRDSKTGKKYTDKEMGIISAVTRQAFGEGGFERFGSNQKFGTNLTGKALADAQGSAWSKVLGAGGNFGGLGRKEMMALAGGALSLGTGGLAMGGTALLLAGATLGDTRTDEFGSMGYGLGDLANDPGAMRAVVELGGGLTTGAQFGDLSRDLSGYADWLAEGGSGQFMGGKYEGYGLDSGNMKELSKLFGRAGEANQDDLASFLGAIGELGEVTASGTALKYKDAFTASGKRMRKALGRSRFMESKEDWTATEQSFAGTLEAYIAARESGVVEDIDLRGGLLVDALNEGGRFKHDWMSTVGGLGTGGENILWAQQLGDLELGGIEDTAEGRKTLKRRLGGAGFNPKEIELLMEQGGIKEKLESGGKIDEGEAEEVLSRLIKGAIRDEGLVGETTVTTGGVHGDVAAMATQVEESLASTQQRTSQFMTETAAALSTVEDLNARLGQQVEVLKKEH